MPQLTDLTLVELRASTKAQILTSIRDYLQANFTRRELIRFLRDRDEEPDEPIRTFRHDGQIESQTEVYRDIETGDIVSTKEITWTYYEDEPGHPVDTITIDESGSKKIIKHYLDKQPEVL